MVRISNPEISIEELRSRFAYDPEAGVLTHAIRASNVPAGSVVGARCKGRKTVGIDGRSVLVSRVVWAIHYGMWPQFLIDHIDCDHANDRIANLREATFQQNMWNRPKFKSASGRRGVCWDKHHKKWFAIIVHNKIRMFLGRYDTIEEASAVYEAKSKELKGEWYSPSRPIKVTSALLRCP